MIVHYMSFVLERIPIIDATCQINSETLLLTGLGTVISSDKQPVKLVKFERF
jgi:hypothetical protein